MLSINLQPVFAARGIERPHAFLVKAGIPSHTAHKLLAKNVRIFRLDHIEIICHALNCTPHDIMLYTTSKNKPIPADHPITTLNQQSTAFQLKQTLSTIPLHQINQIAEIINKLNNPE
jgi:DNA-binding Xre family transcriptional regulator